MSTPAQARFNANPILTSLMITGTAQAGLVAMQHYEIGRASCRERV